MKRIVILLFSVFFLLVFACQKENKVVDQTPDIELQRYSEVEPPQDEPQTGGGDDISPVTQLDGSNDAVITDDELKQIGKKIIKNAEIQFVADDYADFTGYLRKVIKKYDAYIQNEVETSYDNSPQTNFVIRVKNSQFDSLLNDIFNGKGEVTYKSIKIEDVTSEYIDVYQHTKTLLLQKKRFEEIMKNANTVNDILNVTNYLNQVDAQIDRSKAQLKYLEKASAYSTINITVSAKGKVVKDTFFSKLVKAISAGWQGLLKFILAVFYLWPFWILIIIVIFVVKKTRKKRSNKIKNG